MKNILLSIAVFAAVHSVYADVANVIFDTTAFSIPYDSRITGDELLGCTNWFAGYFHTVSDPLAGDRLIQQYTVELYMDPYGFILPGNAINTPFEVGMINVVFRLYNAADIAGATLYFESAPINDIVIKPAGEDFPYQRIILMPGDVDRYIDGGAWYAIPEPMAALLIACVGVTLGFYRRFFSKV